jgi:hypothetical protein
MIEAAVIDFLESLDEAQRRAAAFPFASDERFNWHYIPRERNGVWLGDLNESQHKAAMAVLRSALSERGYQRCRDIMQLETVVAEIEDDDETYDPGNYALTVFGTPGNGAAWGWRIDGHHLSLNFTHAADGVAVTPTFFGANPATVEKGHLAGLRVLGEEEDCGRALMHRLDEKQRDVAIIRAKAFDDILTGPGREESLRQPAGLALQDMPQACRDMALRIVEQFFGAMQAAAVEAQRRRLREAGAGCLQFAWAGSIEPRKPHYYRLHGPTLLIEYDNTQNDANHIHSVWHDPAGDFGADLLRQHYEHPSHSHG